MLRRAYAKLNLALTVGGPDAGWHMHPIASWMHSIDLFDDVEVELRRGEPRGASRRPAPGSRDALVLDWAPEAPVMGELDWGPDQDLGVKALRVLEAHVGEPLPVKLRIAKRIPLGGGLGGGSSDAAAVMRAANELFGLGLALPELARLSRAVGSDVAFFLDEETPPRPALVTGFGQFIERKERAKAEVVLIVPPFGCNTRDVYMAFDRRAQARLRYDEVSALAASSTVDGERLFNDLAAAAERVRPELTGLRSRLAAAVDEPVHLTGSGSTLFVMTEDPVDAAKRLSLASPESAVVRTRLI